MRPSRSKTSSRRRRRISRSPDTFTASTSSRWPHIGKDRHMIPPVSFVFCCQATLGRNATAGCRRSLVRRVALPTVDNRAGYSRGALAFRLKVLHFLLRRRHPRQRRCSAPGCAAESVVKGFLRDPGLRRSRSPHPRSYLTTHLQPLQFSTEGKSSGVP
jgi:hypothetical protein